MNNRVEFGSHVRQLRRRKKLTLENVAKRTGLSVTYLSQVERGCLPPPAEKRVIALAKIFGEDADRFLVEAGRLPPKAREMIYSRSECAAFLECMRRFTRGDMLALSDFLTTVAEMPKARQEKLLAKHEFDCRGFVKALALWDPAPMRAYTSPPGSNREARLETPVPVEVQTDRPISFDDVRRG